MSRIKEGIKHPAIIAKKISLMDRFDDVELRALSGWDTFMLNERRFLSLYPWFKNVKGTCEAIGVTTKWYRKRCQENYLFQQAVAERSLSAVKFARFMATDLVGKAMTELQAMMEQDADKKIKLQAVEKILKISGVLSEGASGSGPFSGAYIDKAQIQLFGAAVGARGDEKETLLGPADEEKT